MGRASFALTDSSRSRTLQVELWYPAAASARAASTAGTPSEDQEAAGPQHDKLASLMASAPQKCANRIAHSAPDAPPADGLFPLVAFSHCHGCTRYSTSTVAERLASHGIAVVAPDHTGNTLWDALANTNVRVDEAFLAVRAADIRFVLDAALDPASASGNQFPTALRHFDVNKVGVFGHSFGSLTTGLVAQTDPRVRAAAGIAAPMALFAPTTMPEIHVPLLMLLSAEDHSIGAVGNSILRGNFKDANGPARLVEVADAGHWSYSDLCGVVEAWKDGCGSATRTTGEHGGEDFQFIPNTESRGIAAAYVTAFFREQLAGDAAGGQYVNAAHPSDKTITTTK